MKKRFLLNSISGGAQFIFATALVIIAVPVFITQLGIEKYGIFSLVQVISSFSIFLGLGISSSLLKFLSEQGKSRESNLDLFTSFFLLTATYIPFISAGFIFNVPILKMLGVPSEFITEDTIWLFNFLLIANYFQFVVQIPVTILDSLQKIYITNFFLSIYQILYWFLIIISILIYNSLAVLGFGILISVVLWFITISITAYKSWGAVRFNFKRKEILTSLKKQLSYSYKLYLGSIINFFYEPFTKILIANFIGVTEVGYFEIILRVRTQLWGILRKLIYPIFPYVSQIKELSKIRNIVNDVEQKLTYISVFLITVIIFTCSDFIFIWLKSDNPVLITGMIFLVTSNLLAVIFVPIYEFLVLKGYPEKTIIIQSLNVLVNIVIFFLFYQNIGFYAVILGAVTATLLSSLLCLKYQWKYLNSLVFETKEQVYKILVLLLILIISGYITDASLTDPVIQIFFLPMIQLLVTVLFIRILGLITWDDILRYSGESVITRDILTKIFLKSKC